MLCQACVALPEDPEVSQREAGAEGSYPLLGVQEVLYVGSSILKYNCSLRDVGQGPHS